MTTTPALAPLSVEQLDKLASKVREIRADIEGFDGDARGMYEALEVAERQFLESALIAQARASQGTDAAAPSHETIVSEGGALVCTACGTSATPQSQVATYTAEDAEDARQMHLCSVAGAGLAPRPGERWIFKVADGCSYCAELGRRAAMKKGAV